LPAVPDTDVGELGTVEAESGVTPADALDAGPVPAALVAVTVKVYSTPLVRVFTWQLVLAVEQKAPPGAAVAVYEVIALPPLLAGADQLTVTCSSPGMPDTEVGAPGIVNGVTEEEAEDAALLPTLLVATAVKVYAVPLVRPVTTSGDEAPEAVKPPGLEVTV
jgi:hypothetical protein